MPFECCFCASRVKDDEPTPAPRTAGTARTVRTAGGGLQAFAAPKVAGVEGGTAPGTAALALVAKAEAASLASAEPSKQGGIRALTSSRAGTRGGEARDGGLGTAAWAPSREGGGPLPSSAWPPRTHDSRRGVASARPGHGSALGPRSAGVEADAERSSLSRPREDLSPLANPEEAMAQTEGLLREGSLASLLRALGMLRRLVVFHGALIEGVMEDMALLMLRCLGHASNSVRTVAALAVGDLCSIFGDAMLRHLHAPHDGGQSLVLALLGVATGAHRGAAGAASATLGLYVLRLDQGSVVRQLERYLQHPNAAMRSKASLLLMTATYRLQ